MVGILGSRTASSILLQQPAYFLLSLLLSLPVLCLFISVSRPISFLCWFVSFFIYYLFSLWLPTLRPICAFQFLSALSVYIFLNLPCLCLFCFSISPVLVSHVLPISYCPVCLYLYPVFVFMCIARSLSLSFCVFLLHLSLWVYPYLLSWFFFVFPPAFVSLYLHLSSAFVSTCLHLSAFFVSLCLCLSDFFVSLFLYLSSNFVSLCLYPSSVCVPLCLYLSYEIQVYCQIFNFQYLFPLRTELFLFILSFWYTLLEYLSWWHIITQFDNWGVLSAHSSIKPAPIL